MTEFDLDAHWQRLLTTALLGTERRDPPAPASGPVGEVVVDLVRRDAAARLLADVAATAAVRRAAFVPGPPAPLLAPPAPDPRPECPAAAVTTWWTLGDTWPVLADEWLDVAVAHGWRLPADVVVALLGTHRRDPIRWHRAALAAGPVAAWLLEHVPGLVGPSAGRDLRASGPASATGGRSGRPSGSAAADSSQLPALPEFLPRPELPAVPELPVPPELAELLTVDAHTFVTRLLPPFEEGRVGAAHRPVVVNLLARCRPEVLAAAADALGSVDPLSASAATAASLADLARTRLRMLAELAPVRAASV